MFHAFIVEAADRSCGRKVVGAGRGVVSRWGEYLKNLFNPTDTPSDEEAESESLEMEPPISGAEIAKVVKKLLDGKAPGVEEVRS